MWHWLKKNHPILYEVLDCINVFKYIKEKPWEALLQIITTVVVSFIGTLVIALIKVYRG